MNGYRIIASCLWLCLTATVSAQSFEEYKRQQQAKFSTYAQKKAEEYRAYRDRVNAEYADYMRRAWTQEEAQPAKPLPKRPEPPQPVVRKPTDMPTLQPIPFGKVRDIPLPKVTLPTPVIPIDALEEPLPTIPGQQSSESEKEPESLEEPVAEPIAKPEEPEEESLSFLCFNGEWQVPLTERHRFRLRSTKEADVADAWRELSKAKYTSVVAACLRLRNTLRLPDWAYLHLLENMSRAFFPKNENEARLLQMFILVQSGYQARIAQADGQLYLLVPSSGDICEYSFLTIGGRRFYVTEKGVKARSFRVFEREFPREQPFSWCMREQPSLPSTYRSRSLQSKRYPEAQATVRVSVALLNLCENYPRCNEWNFYALAGLSEVAREDLYPALRQAIAGKTRKEQVDVLLDFVQTAFAYKADAEQFGAERPLFGDETLFYPYSDCEDRAILFSILVRDLVGTDVVLLEYADHLATAVRLGDDVVGDYLELDGHRYVVCDPTYVGSTVGMAMPQYKGTETVVIRIGD